MAATPAYNYDELTAFAEPLGLVVNCPYEKDNTTYHIIGKGVIVELLVGAHPTSVKSEIKKYHRYCVRRGEPFVHPFTRQMVRRNFSHTRDVMEAFQAATYIPPSAYYKNAYSVSDQKFIMMRIYGEQNGRCAYCHNSISFKDGTIDHIVPYSRGGIDNPANWAFACSPCNNRKGSMTATEFHAQRSQTTGV